MKNKIILSIVILAGICCIWIVLGFVFGYYFNSNENCNYIGLTKQEVLKFSLEKDRRVFNNQEVRISMQLPHHSYMDNKYYRNLIDAQSDKKLMDSDSWCVNYRFRGLQAVPLPAYVAGRTYYYKLVFKDNMVVSQKYSCYSD